MCVVFVGTLFACSCMQSSGFIHSGKFSVYTLTLCPSVSINDNIVGFSSNEWREGKRAGTMEGWR